MEVQLNTLYVVTRGSTVRRDHLTLQVIVEKVVRITVPVHQLESVAVFGGVHVTPSAMGLCAENGVAVNFLTESGRLLARVDAPSSGNVLLRREQFRKADDALARATVSRCVVAGKVQNCRNLMLRSARETTDATDQAALTAATIHLASVLSPLETDTDANTVRGREGDAAREYFAAFGAMVRTNRVEFTPAGRTRRPPLDRMNSLLSFLYGLLTHDCVSACSAAGLDPSVGFLHVDRPGRPGLALDLMEEFRPLLADRLALALVNRQQVKPGGFEIRDGGAVMMDDTTRKAVLSGYQQRKREEVTHPYLNQKVPLGRFPFLQARILARYLRGDLPSYVPCITKN
ncbi:MAG: type I-C CRISPR-associated endonuclease Cas1c [Planctomycetes bacterium]|nr:type I-C CRISPR-associated endonuclease Cas1c [Planctomycetota bacterium]